MREQKIRRVRLVTTFVAMVVTFCMMCMGIYAASTAALTVQGGIQLGGTSNIAATVTAAYKMNNEADNAIALPDRDNTTTNDTAAKFTLDDADTTAYQGSVSVPAIELESKDETVTFTFEITNDMPTQSLNVTFDATVGQECLTTTVTGENDGVDAGNIDATTVVVAPGKTFVITVLIEQKGDFSDTGFSAAYDFALLLSRHVSNA